MSPFSAPCWRLVRNVLVSGVRLPTIHHPPPGNDNIYNIYTPPEYSGCSTNICPYHRCRAVTGPWAINLIKSGTNVTRWLSLPRRPHPLYMLYHTRINFYKQKHYKHGQLGVKLLATRTICHILSKAFSKGENQNENRDKIKPMKLWVKHS